MGVQRYRVRLPVHLLRLPGRLVEVGRGQTDHGQHVVGDLRQQVGPGQVLLPGQVGDGHIGRGVADGGQGDLRVVRVAPGEGRRLQGVGSAVLVGVRVQHDLQPGAVTAAEQVPEGDGPGRELGADHTGGEGRAAAGEAAGEGRSRSGAEGALEQRSPGQPSRVREVMERSRATSWPTLAVVRPLAAGRGPTTSYDRGHASLWRHSPGISATNTSRRAAGPNPPLVGSAHSDVLRHHMVGVTGFEPATSSSRTKRATKLRHTPLASAKASHSLAETLARPHIASDGRSGLTAGRPGSSGWLRVGRRSGRARTGRCPARPRRAGTTSCRRRCAATDPSPGRVSRSQLVTSAP